MKKINLIYNTSPATSIGRMMNRLAGALSGAADCSLNTYDIKAGYLSKLKHFLIPRFGIWRDTFRAQVLVIHTSVVYSLAQIMIAKLTGTRIVVFMWDIYPDSYVAFRNRKLRGLFAVYGFLERLILRMADTVFLPSQDYCAVVKKTGVRHPVIFPLWPFTKETAAGTTRRDPDALHIGFAGAVNALRGLPEAIARLGAINGGKIVLHIYSPDEIDFGAFSPADNIDIVAHGFVDQSALVQQMRLLDAGLACLSAGFDQPAFPSKIVSYISSGIPVVYCGPTLAGVSSFLDDFGVGVSLPADGNIDLETDLTGIQSNFPESQQAALAYLALTDEKLAYFL